MADAREGDSCLPLSLSLSLTSGGTTFSKMKNCSGKGHVASPRRAAAADCAGRVLCALALYCRRVGCLRRAQRQQKASGYARVTTMNGKRPQRVLSSASRALFCRSARETWLVFAALSTQR